MAVTFGARMSTGLVHEHDVAAALRAMKCKVQPFGRGEWSEISDEMTGRVVTLRHAPDLIVVRQGKFCLVDCKASTPNHFDSPNVIIEADSLTALTSWSQMLDIPAIVVWHDMTFDSVESINHLQTKELRNEGRGSGTPYWLVRRKDLSGRHLSVLGRGQ